MRTLTILLLKFFALSVSPLAAQIEEKSWSIRVAALDIVKDHHTLWLRTAVGKEPIEIPLNTRVFSLPIEHKGVAALEFFATAADASAKEALAPLATTTLKSTASLIIFSPSADLEKYQAFTTSEADFPYGSFRLVNFSQATVQAEIAGKTTLLKPSASESIRVSATENAIPVRILALAEGTPARVVRQTSWSVNATQRELVLFFPNPDNGLVRLRHFVDTKAENPPQ